MIMIEIINRQNVVRTRLSISLLSLQKERFNTCLFRIQLRKKPDSDSVLGE